jgi:predicted DNA-binding protein (UPF0251 family)
MMRGRRRRGRFGRMPRPVRISHTIGVKAFIPEPLNSLEPVHIEPAELEVIMLTDIEDLNQQEAGERMGTSRGTVWRLLQSVRRKIALALIEGRRIEILGHPSGV